MLDLYAGTGAIGIEALSRGAARDRCRVRPKAVQLLQHNVRTVGCSTELKSVRARPPISHADGLWSGPYDIVFADPPYDLADELET